MQIIENKFCYLALRLNFLTKEFINCYFCNSWILLEDRVIRMFNNTVKISLDVERYFIVNKSLMLGNKFIFYA